MEVIIRKANIDDVDKLFCLWCELGKDQLKKDPYYKGNFVADRGYDFKKLLQSQNCCIFVAESDNRVVGFAEARTHVKDFKFYIDDYVYLMHVYVEPGYRGFKLHYRFVEKIEAWALERNFRYLVADVLKTNDGVINLLKMSRFDEYRIRLVKNINADK